MVTALWGLPVSSPTPAAHICPAVAPRGSAASCPYRGPSVSGGMCVPPSTSTSPLQGVFLISHLAGSPQAGDVPVLWGSLVPPLVAPLLGVCRHPLRGAACLPRYAPSCPSLASGRAGLVCLQVHFQNWSRRQAWIFGPLFYTLAPFLPSSFLFSLHLLPSFLSFPSPFSSSYSFKKTFNITSNKSLPK